jgi:hypothetical protein
MNDFIDQVERSLDHGTYYLSLIGALAIPDIAGAIQSTNGEASGQKYIDWYERWARPQYAKQMKQTLPSDVREFVNPENPLSGDVCYRFRCSMLHQGSTQHPRSPFTRILFIEPGACDSVLHYIIQHDALHIDLPQFVGEMASGAREWLAYIEHDATFIANSEKSARRYENGLSPYISGVAVIS